MYYMILLNYSDLDHVFSFFSFIPLELEYMLIKLFVVFFIVVMPRKFYFYWVINHLLRINQTTILSEQLSHWNNNASQNKNVMSHMYFSYYIHGSSFNYSIRFLEAWGIQFLRFDTIWNCLTKRKSNYGEKYTCRFCWILVNKNALGGHSATWHSVPTARP